MPAEMRAAVASSVRRSTASVDWGVCRVVESWDRKVSHDSGLQRRLALMVPRSRRCWDKEGVAGAGASVSLCWVWSCMRCPCVPRWEA